jgi:hypothetical protein
MGFFRHWPYLAICFLWKTDHLLYQTLQVLPQACERKFGFRWAHTPEFYDRYNAWVRQEAEKRGRPVLEFTADMGLAPLAGFLGKGEPPMGEKFPHLNDAATIALLKRILVARGLISWAALGGALWASWEFGLGLVLKA